MNAGILRAAVTLYRKRREQTLSGFEREHLEQYYTCRAYVKRLAVQGDRDGVVAREEFSPHNISFKLRCCSLLDEAVELDYRGKRYLILAQELLPDRTRLLHCRRHDV